LTRASGLAAGQSDVTTGGDSGFALRSRPAFFEEGSWLMPENVQVSCIRKRGDHYNPHERIEALGGIHNSKRWYMTEDDIITELLKPEATRRWGFYTDVDDETAWVIVAERKSRKYLKTTADDDEPNNLLALPECPKS
jgi:hypothetical protein